MRRDDDPGRQGPLQRYWQRWLPLLLAVAAILPFAGSLGHPLFADDYLHAARAQALDQAGPSQLLRSWVLDENDSGAWWTPPELEVRYLRPLVTLAFWLDHRLWGLNPAGYHLTNLLLHVLGTLLTYAIGRRLLGAGVPAAAGALLFAIHPCHGEAVLWVSGRTDLLAAVFVLLAFVLQLEAYKAVGGRSFFIVTSLACFVLALGAKESAAVYPALVALHGWLFRRNLDLRTRLAPLLAPSLMLVSYFVLRYFLFGGFSLPPEPFAQPPDDPVAILGAGLRILLYLVDLVLFIPPDPVLTEPFWMRYWPLFVLVAGLSLWLFSSALRDVKDRRRRYFGLGFMLLCVLPVLFITVGERFLYLPSVGYCLLIGARLDQEGFSRSRKRVAIRAVLAVVFAVACFRSAAFGKLTRASRAVIADALHVIDSMPTKDAVVVVDLPSAAALGFGDALRLERPRRSLTVQIVTITPDFLFSEPKSYSRLTRNGTGDFRLETPPLLWSTYIARAFRGGRQKFRRGEGVSTSAYAIEVREVKNGVPSVLGLTIAAKTLLLKGVPGFRLVPVRTTARH